jgi:spectinomycin phosphotransferase
VWVAAVEDDLVDELRDWTATVWGHGPHGEDARSAVRASLGTLAGDLARYRRLLERLDRASYVTTHGEPGVHNQWRTQDGSLKVIDWETIRLAPAERDLLGDVGKHIRGDLELVELFRLDWKLSEIRSYSDWLRGPHHDDADTRVALDALKSELAS